MAGGPHWETGHSRGVNLVGNLGGRRQTALGSKLLTRKTGRVESWNIWHSRR